MGRKPGSRNRFNKEAVQAVEDAFEAMGGVTGLTAWALLNPTLFYLHIWSKLIPKAVNVEAAVEHREPALPPVNVVQVADVHEALNELERMREQNLSSRLQLEADDD